MPEISIRPATPDEGEEVGRLTETVYRDDGHLFGDEGYADELRDAAGRIRDALVLVAVLDGRLVGAVTLLETGMPGSNTAVSGELEVRMLVVDHPARRQGIADALMDAAEDHARRRGLAAVVLATGQAMVGAHRLYERRGYTRRPDRDWGVGPVPFLVYRRELAPAGVVVRAAREGDVEAVGAITEAAYRGDGFLDIEGGDDYAVLLRDTATRMAEGTVLVAELDGLVVGSVTLAPAGTPWAEVAEPGELEVRMLSVAASARRRGVAEALMAGAEAAARRAGCSVVVLSTMREMAGAQNLYARLGYQRQPHRDWEIDTDMLVYSKPVRSRPVRRASGPPSRPG